MALTPTAVRLVAFPLPKGVVTATLPVITTATVTHVPVLLATVELHTHAHPATTHADHDHVAFPARIARHRDTQQQTHCKVGAQPSTNTYTH